MPARPRCFILAMALMLCVLALDQYSKWLILESLLIPPQHSPRAVCSFFNIVLVWNHGVSFGMFAQARQPLALIVLSVIISVILLIWLAKNTSLLTAWALGCVLGGAAGNVIDRVRYGAVVDFLDFHWGDYHWPAFNVADSCIFIGVVLLCSSSMFTPDQPKPKEPTP
jgi:signal peptidase II